MAKEKAPPRSGEQRRSDVLRRLAEDVDAWVATAGEDGEPCLVPLSFVWHDGVLLMTTRVRNPTAANVRRTGRATVSLDGTRDVVLIEADAEAVADEDLPAALGQAFVDKLGWDTRGRPEWVHLLFRPRTVRAWREQNELEGRQLMRDGGWVV